MKTLNQLIKVGSPNLWMEGDLNMISSVPAITVVTATYLTVVECNYFLNT